jgi:AraC family transcriptional regulator, regulatory protein of adaptative response / methylated-DNA-[protein]-cysteine methyltransferase
LDVVSGITEPIVSVQQECEDYFNGTLKQFTTPLHFLGTPFQQSVWQALQDIPYGETRSYADLAGVIGNPKAHRAVAGANHANPFTIIVPCHRVIYADGSLGGYAGGLTRKQWLLDHERKMR